MYYFDDQRINDVAEYPQHIEAVTPLTGVPVTLPAASLGQRLCSLVVDLFLTPVF